MALKKENAILLVKLTRYQKIINVPLFGTVEPKTTMIAPENAAVLYPSTVTHIDKAYEVNIHSKDFEIIIQESKDS